MVIKRFTITVKEWAGKRMWIRRWLAMSDLKEREISAMGTGPTLTAELGEGVDFGMRWGLEINCQDGEPLIFIGNALIRLNPDAPVLNYSVEVELAQAVDRISFEGRI
jgi:hypothetical protein